MFNNLNIMVFGASGGIGSALVQRFCQNENVSQIHACSRSEKSFDHDKVTSHHVAFNDEKSIENAVRAASSTAPLDLVIVATGLLHNETGLQPEKSIRQLNAENLLEQFMVNAIGPALVAKHVMPKLNKTRMSLFAALSARVGSISDNRLGGWYGYRASKSALNMFLKTTAIEIRRKNKFAVVIGLHPGTVDTQLSKPFQGNVQEGKLFDADFSAEKLLNVVYSRKPEDTGKVFAWDGKEIPF